MFPPFCLHIPVLSHVPKPNPCHTPDRRSSEHHQLSWQLNGLLALMREHFSFTALLSGLVSRPTLSLITCRLTLLHIGVYISASSSA